MNRWSDDGFFNFNKGRTVTRTRLEELYVKWRQREAAKASERENAGRSCECQRIRDEVNGVRKFVQFLIKDMQENPESASERREIRNANNRASYYRRTFKSA